MKKVTHEEAFRHEVRQRSERGMVSIPLSCIEMIMDAMPSGQDQEGLYQDAMQCLEFNDACNRWNPCRQV